VGSPCPGGARSRGPTHTWAPEAFYDPARGQYGIFYSVNNGTRDVFLVNYTTDFRTVSAAQTFFDPGFNVLDGTMFTEGGVNHLYYKNLANGLPFGARSSTLNPGNFNGTTYTSGLRQGNGIEAPIVVKSLTSNTFHLWGDSYSPVNGEFYAWSSTNIGANAWTVLNQRAYAQPLNSKHAGSRRSPRPSTRAWSTGGACRRGTASSRTTSRTATCATRTTSGASTRTRSTRSPTSNGAWCPAWPTRPGCRSSR
jgi:hypothetical protein